MHLADAFLDGLTPGVFAGLEVEAVGEPVFRPPTLAQDQRASQSSAAGPSPSLPGSLPSGGRRASSALPLAKSFRPRCFRYIDPQFTSYGATGGSAHT